MILGVTGCPGSGKSTLAAVMRDEGWKLIDADMLGRKVVESDRGVLGELAKAFGGDILGSEGTLNRRLLAVRAFSDPDSTARLNGIVHPRLIERLISDIGDSRDAGENTVVDCALIFEWGIGNQFDLIVCVRSGAARRLERLVARDGRTELEVEGMFAAQLPEGDKAANSHVVIANEGSVETLRALGRMLACVRL